MCTHGQKQLHNAVIAVIAVVNVDVSLDDVGIVMM